MTGWRDKHERVAAEGPTGEVGALNRPFQHAEVDLSVQEHLLDRAYIVDVQV